MSPSGAGWKRQAREWRTLVTRLADAPFEHVRNAMDSGQTYRHCVVSKLLADLPAPDDARAVRNVSAIIYAAGTDTTAAILHIFLLAMVMHPAAQRSAQSELDALGPFKTARNCPTSTRC